ncbi:hypothetical protein [Maribacter antarcticus]|uniref:hypothetical protein n=1 Tax=Maribacter antarcticus TaxID=505250 RepID=UPI0012EB4348|nr:hypothetical protein [Maribacter antarcticus]
MSEKNRETIEKAPETVPPAHISAPAHELKCAEKHQRNARDSPEGPAGASQKKLSAQ